MSDNKPKFENWQWLDNNEGWQTALIMTLKNKFNAAVRSAEGPALELDIRRAKLTVSPEEARTGAFHPLADGKSFFHVNVTAPDMGNGGNEVFMLAQAFSGISGGTRLSLGDSPKLTFDCRTTQEVEALIKALPQVIDIGRKPQ